jgi:polar amino acid transport system substrate-binding protein
MKTKSARIVLLMLVALCFVNCARAVEKESVYDRVMRTGVVRIAYAEDPPLLMKDPNTGKLTGLLYDITNKALTDLQLKPEWTEEVSWGQMPEVLASGRADITSCGLFVSAARARVIDYSIMLFYTPEGVWVRSDDHRFDTDLNKINDPSVTIAVIDGEMSSVIAQNVFPHAKPLTLPQLSDLAQNLLNVVSKKADVTFVESAIALEYLKHNPGTLRNVAATKPFRVFGNGISFRRGETEFKSMINLELQQLLDFGYVEEMLKKYEPFPGTYYRVAPPYVLK